MATREQTNDQFAPSAYEEVEETVDVLDIFLILLRRLRMIGIVTLASLLIGIALIFLLKPNFTATAIILPPQQSSSSSALLGQLGSLMAFSGGGGGTSALGLKSPADMYVGILKSRTIADAIIDQFRLEAVYKRKKMQDTRKELKSHSEIEAGKDGLIDISVTDHDPRRASDIANAYVSELYDMNANLAIGEAAQRRVFFDREVDAEKKALAAAEEDLRATQQKTGIILPTGQTAVIIESIAQLRAKIASSQVELQAMQTFATEQNPDVTRLQEQITSMQAQLAKLENDQGNQQPGNIEVPAGRVPEDALEYGRKLREVKYHEALFDLLSRQYEAARIDEAKSAPIIQVIDNAVPPDKKSGPHGLLLTLGLGFAGFCLACFWALLKNGLRRMEQVPERAEKLHRLRAALHR